jgi:hypothetical protein
MPTRIKFGTSGWHAVMAEEFTFDNVRRCRNRGKTSSPLCFAAKWLQSEASLSAND